MAQYDKLPQFLLNDLMEAGYDRDKLKTMTPIEIFEKYCEWNGIIGYSGRMWSAVVSLYNSQDENP